MALSEDSVSRDNLLFYLDWMEAPDDEVDGGIYSYTAYLSIPKFLLAEDLSGTYANKR